jgi:hypothetical protein
MLSPFPEQGCPHHLVHDRQIRARHIYEQLCARQSPTNERNGDREQEEVSIEYGQPHYNCSNLHFIDHGRMKL